MNLENRELYPLAPGTGGPAGFFHRRPGFRRTIRQRDFDPMIFAPFLTTPKITGIIDRRILINFRVDPKVAKDHLPSPFKPLEIEGATIVGICLIRLKKMRPLGWPKTFGFSAENAAHRYSVTWPNSSKTSHSGVFIPRRDTSSKIIALTGDRLFPGQQHLSNFQVTESSSSFEVHIDHKNQKLMNIHCKITPDFPSSSLFSTLEDVSDFFKEGSVGYSPTRRASLYHGMKLLTDKWEVTPLEIVELYSSHFFNEDLFPKGSVEFDNAILMKNIPHSWSTEPTLSSSE